MNDLARITATKSAASVGFVENSRKVASTPREMLEEVETFLKRFESRADARFKEGREMSESNWNALRDVHDQHIAMRDTHAAMCDRMAGILDRTKPKGKGKTSIEVMPALAPVVALPTKSDPVSVPEISDDDVFAMYAQTMIATNLALSS